MSPVPSHVTVVSHPLVQHKLTKMRDRTTSTKTFRALMREVATLICYEITRDLPRLRVSRPYCEAASF